MSVVRTVTIYLKWSAQRVEVGSSHVLEKAHGHIGRFRSQSNLCPGTAHHAEIRRSRQRPKQAFRTPLPPKPRLKDVNGVVTDSNNSPSHQWRNDHVDKADGDRNGSLNSEYLPNHGACGQKRLRPLCNVDPLWGHSGVASLSRLERSGEPRPVAGGVALAARRHPSPHSQAEARCCRINNSRSMSWRCASTSSSSGLGPPVSRCQKPNLLTHSTVHGKTSN